jgi:hypothetical protein
MSRMRGDVFTFVRSLKAAISRAAVALPRNGT